MKPIVLIDSNCLCHMAKHTMSGLSFDDMATGIIFGFLRQIKSIAKTLKSNRLIFAWDSKESWRRKIYPDYKKARREKVRTNVEKMEDKIAYEQFDKLRTQILPQIGFRNIFILEGYESDDIIGDLIHNMAFSPIADFIIVSTDNDFYQLLNKYVTIFNPKTKKIYRRDDFVREYGIAPLYWAHVKSLAGCQSDGVPGIKGVGELTAVRYLNGDIVKGKVFDRIIEDLKLEKNSVFKRNTRLVCLQSPPTNRFVIQEDAFNLDCFIDVCQRYGFQSMLRGEELKSWREVFCK